MTSGTIVADSGQLDVTGNATISGNFTSQRIGSLRMAGGANLAVTGSVTFSGASTAGLLQAGRLTVGGHFTQSSSSLTFAADSAHVTALNGTAAQNVSMANPSSTLSRFAALEVSNTSTGGVVFVTDAVAKGDLVVPGTANDSVRFGVSGSPVLTVGGVNVSNAGATRARFKALRLVIKNFGLGSVTQFDGAVFEGFDTTHTQLSYEFADASSHTFNNLTFMTVPTSGRYVQMNALSTTLDIVGATPASPGLFALVLLGVLNW